MNASCYGGQDGMFTISVVGGKAPVVITSRSDEAESRLASIAAAVVALK